MQRLQFHMWAAYAVLVAASGGVYAAFAVQHFVYHGANPPVIEAAITTCFVVALSASVFIVWRRPRDFAGWLGLIFWGGGLLLGLLLQLTGVITVAPKVRPRPAAPTARVHPDLGVARGFTRR
jgi:hypothetical protein